MLKMTEIKLELNSDIDIHYFVERRLIVGISYNSKRFGEANKKYMKNYDPTRESKCIINLDANNSYVWGMNTYLLYGEFKC